MTVLTFASKKITTKYNHQWDSIQIKIALAHTNTQSKTKQKKKEKIKHLHSAVIHFFKHGRCCKIGLSLSDDQSTTDQLIMARPPKLHLLLSMSEMTSNIKG
jgi:hypothetical protein